MKCENHPDRYATTRCHGCKVAICDECTVPLDDGRLMCDRCSLLTILQDRHKKAKEKIQAKKKERDLGAAHKRRLRHVRKWAPVFGLLIIAFIGAHAYSNTPITDSQVVNLTENPDAMMLVLDQAIRDYVENNDGFIPNTLSELIGEYLPPERFKPKDLNRFVYVRNRDNSYRIWPKKPGNAPIPDFIVTEKGLEPKNVP